MQRIIKETELGSVWTQSVEPSRIDLKDITSNGQGNLLRHPEKMALIQAGKTPSPIMVHLALTNVCDITCDTCCYANRKFTEELSLNQAHLAVENTRRLGTTGLEHTGGGEPLMYKGLNEVVDHAHELGFEQGMCTNGKRLEKIKDPGKFKWIRIGMYGFDEGYPYDEKLIESMRAQAVDITAAYIWAGRVNTIINPNVVGGHDDVIRRLTARHNQTDQSFDEMISFVERMKIPTRIAVDAIRPTEQVLEDYAHLDEYMATNWPDAQYAKASGQRYIPGRPNDNCYMWMVKPFIIPWGNEGNGVLVDCPSTVLSPENGFRVNPRFVVCTIDGIPEYYAQGASRRQHPCKYCNFSRYNSEIDAMVTPKRHSSFA